MAVTVTDPTDLDGVTVAGTRGAKLGTVDSVYLDSDTDQIGWAAVRTGLWGEHLSLVPLATADYEDGVLRLPFDEDQVRSAPHHDPEQTLSADDEVELFAHYGVAHEEGALAARSGPAASGPGTDDAMTRSEEELRVDTRTVATGTARLRKYVVTEQQTVTVPVSHEEITVSHEPITDADREATTSGATISEEEHGVTLHAEQPVVTTETVARERVTMGVETVHEEQEISGEVRQERIEATTDGGSADAERGRD